MNQEFSVNFANLFRAKDALFPPTKQKLDQLVHVFCLAVLSRWELPNRLVKLLAVTVRFVLEDMKTLVL